MSKIFISYRRDDSAPTTGRIYDRLIAHFGKDTIFKDVDNIPSGENFPRFIAGVVEDCAVMLAIIGPYWVDAATPSGQRRLDNPDDFVRVEIESALQRGIPVIPVLVQGARMPTKDQLPSSLQRLVDLNGLAVRNDPDFNGDIYRLQTTLERWVPRSDGAALSAVIREFAQTAPPPEPVAMQRPKEKQSAGPINPNERSLRWYALAVGLAAGFATGLPSMAAVGLWNYEVTWLPPLLAAVALAVDLTAPSLAGILVARSTKQSRTVTIAAVFTGMLFALGLGLGLDIFWSRDCCSVVGQTWGDLLTFVAMGVIGIAGGGFTALSGQLALRNARLS